PSALDLRPVEIPKVVGHVCELLRPEAAAREIEISARWPEATPPVVADSAQLTQALMNVVINAIQEGGRNGRVEGSGIGNQQDMLTVAVRDTGPGIPPERRSAIFEPFYTTKSEGSGLGLWIVQQIVTAHEGTVEVGNAPGGGAVFALHLPLRRKPD